MRLPARAILFDLDGTLIDSVPDLAAALADTMRALGREPCDEARVREWVGNGARVLVKRALCGGMEIDESACAGIFDDALATFMRAYEKRMCEKTRLYPEVATTLSRLREKGAKMAVVTNKPGPFVAPILRHLGIEGHFDLIVGGEDLPRKKPDPMPLLHACEKLGVQPSEAVMVGDSRNDIEAAKRAGMPAVAVRYGYNHGEPVEALFPERVIDRFGELPDILEV
ncbi:phosphoglycolate phosphatase [Hydrogenimonas sp.]